ncbi:MAG: sensor histidine kinase [Coprococcus sp.]|nr:sensor histidine kinase [Coprococcus sp.]
MHYIQDILLLLIYSLFSAQYHEIDFVFVLAFLFAVIYAFLGFCLKSMWLRQILGLFFLAGAVLVPPLFFFYPSAVYIFIRDKHYVSCLSAFLICVCLLFTGHTAFFHTAFCMFGCFLAIFLQYRTMRFEELSAKYRRTQDDSRERNLLLSERNHSLLERQNIEIYTATLKERNRIAREIHDNVGHVLSRSILLLGAVKTINKDESLLPLLSDLEGALNQAMDNIRSSVHDLHDESINLESAIQGLIRDFTFCPVEFKYDMHLNIPKEVKYCFISITKEALSNIIRHSSADQVRILLREHPALYQLCIEDNGAKSSPGGSGIGLANMRERVQALNGRFQISTEHGFQIFITIPKGE